MKRFLIVGSILCVAAVASAEPVSTTTSTATTPTSEKYVEPGMMITTLGGVAVDALTMELGHQLGHGPLGIHVMTAFGGPFREPGGFGIFAAAQAGLEARACVSEGLCGFAGVDAGVRYFDNADGFNREMNVTSAIVVPRVGLDFGTKKLRVRPGIEKIVDGRNNDLAGTVGVALVW